jgi:parallel beta-helix repeat protein
LENDYGEIMAYNKIIIIICLIILNIGFASAATLNVGQGQAYATIQSAIDAAKTGDTISVAEGTYSENLVVKTNDISIIGENKEKTIIDGKKIGSIIKIDQANNVRVSGFTVQNSGGSGQSDGGVSLFSASNNMIANLILLNNAMGITIYSSSNNNIVSGNDIKSSKYGIFIFSSIDNKIYNNNIQNNKIGIYCDSARTNSFYSNNFIDNNDQAFDNSGMNSWDDGKSGNYWNVNKGILGGKNAKDSYPLASAVTIKYEDIQTPAGQNTQGTTSGGTGKSSPGFAGFAVLVSLIVISILSKKK